MKIKKSDLLNMIQEQDDVIAKLIRQVNCHHEDIIRLEGVVEPQPQLIAIRSKRDIEKELLEVDLGSELTGSDLARAMINRGDKIVLCIVKDYEHENDIYYDAITHCSGDYFDSTLSSWRYVTPINNQGEPLAASEVGL